MNKHIYPFTLRLNLSFSQLIIVNILSLFLSCIMVCQQGMASPWTLPKDRLVITMSTGYSYAYDEFINDEKGTLQNFPLQGNMQIFSLGIGGRYGLKDHLELEIATSLRSLIYSADSFVLPTGEILQINNQEVGLGDVYVILTKQILSKRWPLSFQTALKLPTGYTIPEPNKIALGSGQADISGMFQLGHIFSYGMLVGLEGGMVLRLNGPAHQVKYGVKVAQRISGRLFLFVAQTGYHSITEGEKTGLFNSVSPNPDVPAENFDLDDTYQLPFTLTQNLHQAEAGFFLGTTTKVEYSGAIIIPWAGKNAARLMSVFFNVSHPL